MKIRTEPSSQQLLDELLAGAVSLREGFVTMHSTLDRIDGRLDRIDGHLLVLNDTLDRIDARLTSIDGRLDTMGEPATQHDWDNANPDSISDEIVMTRVEAVELGCPNWELAQIAFCEILHGVDEFMLNELKDRYDMLVLDELAAASVPEMPGSDQ